ncbi:MAG TPA: hypothetical protein VGD40_04095 [Chryseosolibacter sp.]
MDKMVSSIAYFRQFSFLQIFTIYLRYLIGGAFIVAAFGMGKFNNQELLISSPGVSIEKLEPIQQFFRVMATSGLYWKFIGWSQVVAGVLLMTQRFAKLGAALFFGMILNIFIITISYEFKGTPIVTGLMLLAATYLIVWDFESFQFLLRRPTVRTESQSLRIADRSYWVIVGILMFTFILACVMVGYNILYQLAGCVVLGVVAFVLFFTAFYKKAEHELSL